jgi:hypothetical protein
MKIHALEGGSLSLAAPSHSPGALRDRRGPGDQGMATPHHTSAAATVGSASLSWPWAAGQPPSEACLCLGLALGRWGTEGIG